MEFPLTDRAKKKGVRSGVLSKLAFAKFEIPIKHQMEIFHKQLDVQTWSSGEQSSFDL